MNNSQQSLFYSYTKLQPPADRSYPLDSSPFSCHICYVTKHLISGHSPPAKVKDVLKINPVVCDVVIHTYEGESVAIDFNIMGKIW